MRFEVATVLAACLLFATPRVFAEEASFDPDFHFIFMACQITGSSLGEPPSKNDGFMEMKTKPHHTACERVGKKQLSCITVFEENAKPAYYDMTITTEASKLLTMESENAGDFLMVRPDTGRVISTTRMADEKYLAVKLCHGVYMTGDEFKGWQARDNKKKSKKAKSR